MSLALPQIADLRRPFKAPEASATRLLEIAVAAAGLILLAPLMLCIAAAILLESGRPIFFSHVRLGKAGRPFRMHKFRKFREHDCPAGGSLTVERDPRLTIVGRALVRSKLDELPQLWNVLVGDMSLVGPRPESLAFADCFEGRYRSVLDYKPGIFGPSQTVLRNEARLYSRNADPERFYREFLFPLKARIDLAYFPRRTVTGDLDWVARGILAVLGLASPRLSVPMLSDAAVDAASDGGAVDSSSPPRALSDPELSPRPAAEGNARGL